MKEIVFEGEHLAVGNLGYLFVILSFAGALISFISYSIQAGKKGAFEAGDRGWLKIGRFSFFVHALGVLGIVGTLFFIIQQHYYEFYYVWRHSSNALPLKYMISCFWEGQEGSFLLWTFWHVILVFFFLTRARKWEAPAMVTIMLAQVMLSSMLLGMPMGDGEFLGLNPFRLTRIEMEAPIFASADYLASFVDGKGLNPLLQNYWMVIHPPTLFLGFAATIFPFALAIAALITGDFKGWVKPALPWTVFTVGILGAGILMGGIWAYEALSFGGFWAWDPVENAVLVPWMFVVGGLHTMVIFKNTGRALMTTLIWISLGFLLILYSTYLTRSGVLGDTSVHSFTADGLMAQLISFVVVFVLITVVAIVVRYKQIPKSPKEEEITSREIWMFIGSIVLAIAGFQILFTTSIPVINKILNATFLSSIFGAGKLAPPDDPVAHYNQFQVPFAVLIALLTAVGQYFKYRKTSMGKFYKRALITFFISVLLTGGAMVLTKISNPLHITLMLASIYSVVGNIDILFNTKKLTFSGGAVAHIGFGLLLLGALISTSKKNVVSVNKMGYDYGEDYSTDEKGKNVYLPLDKPVLMSDFLVTYKGDSVVEPNHYYKVDYQEFNAETGEKGKRFRLTPNAQINPSMGLLANPSTKRYWNKDIYTHVSSVDAEGPKSEFEPPKTYSIRKGDTISHQDFTMEMVGLETKSDLPKDLAILQEEGDTLSIAALNLKISYGGEEYEAQPLMIVKGTQLLRPPFDIDEIGLRLYFSMIDVESGNLELAVSAKSKQSPKFIIMKAIEFPYINILWLGCIVMVLGTFLSVYRRLKLG